MEFSGSTRLQNTDQLPSSVSVRQPGGSTTESEGQPGPFQASPPPRLRLQAQRTREMGKGENVPSSLGHLLPEAWKQSETTDFPGEKQESPNEGQGQMLAGFIGFDYLTIRCLFL